MKKKIIIPVLLVLIALAWAFSYRQYRENEEKKEQYQTLPDFTFYAIEKDTILPAALEQNMSTVIMFFNSECDYCLLELSTIEKNIEKFSDIQLALISSEPVDSLRNFKKQFDFSPAPAAGIYYAKLDHLVEKFVDVPTPSALIYDTEGKLIRQFKGFTKIDDILDVIYPDSQHQGRETVHRQDNDSLAI